VSIQRKTESVCSEIYRLLREERERRGLSKYALSGMTGLSQQTIGYLEREMTAPSLDTVLRIVRAMEIDFGKLITDAETRASRKTVVRVRSSARQTKAK
jgi:transcriptional regulator with XRE-family HTH domain